MRYGNDASSLEDVVEVKEDLIVQMADLQAVRG
jgi:hypothetical protein